MCRVLLVSLIGLVNVLSGISLQVALYPQTNSGYSEIPNNCYTRRQSLMRFCFVILFFSVFVVIILLVMTFGSSILLRVG